jgi:hypothetical protein
MNPERCASFVCDVVSVLVITVAMLSIVATLGVWVPFLVGKIP